MREIAIAQMVVGFARGALGYYIDSEGVTVVGGMVFGWGLIDFFFKK